MRPDTHNPTSTGADSNRGSPRRWMRTEEAADYCGRQGKSTLDKLRITGGGPPYVKRGNVVIYDRLDLDRWLEDRKVRSTSEPVRAA